MPNKVLPSIIDGLGTGVGFLVACVIIGLLREFLGKGGLTLTNPFTSEIIFSSYPLADYAISLFTSKSGAFLTLGLVVGISSFITEISSAVTITVFNFILLDIAGNMGIAAYGIVANIALVAVAIFNGITLGMQPLLSESFGKKEEKSVKKYYKYGIITTIVCVICIILFVYIFTDSINL